MKPIFALLCAAAVLLPVYSAQADFVPGRVRPGQEAQMEVVSAAGPYQGVQTALVTLNFADGNPSPVSVTVKPEGHETVTLAITEIRPSGCGDKIHAESPASFPQDYELDLVDYSRAICERVIPNIWEIELRRQEARGALLSLVGNPHGLYVTL